MDVAAWMRCTVSDELKSKGLVAEAVASGQETASRRSRACYHCGEPCHEGGPGDADKVFCCVGCRVVHDLLVENGLEHFYNLNPHAGVRMRNRDRRERWSCLDEPAVRQRMLDFADDRINRVTWRVPAIHCVACVWLLESLYRLHPGIGRSVVRFGRREVTVDFGPNQIQLSELASLMASIGYEPMLTLGELDRERLDPGWRRQWIQLGVAGFCFGNIMLFSLPQYFGLDRSSGPVFRPLFAWLSLALALPVLLYSASDFWRAARLAVRQRMLTLEVPIAAGLAALFVTSAWDVVAGRGAGYLDSLTGLVFFLLCGRAFQHKTQDLLTFDRDYKSFFPLSVTRRSGALEEHVAISSLSVGDRVVLRSGDLIPADSRLAVGDALVDYSFVTGESDPVEKLEGDYLYAGGRNTGGLVELEIVKPVSESYLTGLWNDETFRKPANGDLDTLTNRYSRRFTWVVAGVAVLAAVAWALLGDPGRGLRAFLSVLIVACPCALALAAPFTLGTARRCLSKAGVHLRNSFVIERMAQVDEVVFDKTGTLTVPSVVAAFHGLRLDATEETQVYSLVRHSTHPLSRRIEESLAGRCQELPVDAFREIAGSGIEGRSGGHEVLLGSPRWLVSQGVGIDDALAEGETLVGLAVDGAWRGAFALSSALRPGVDSMLNAVSRHYEVALLSGDNERSREFFGNWFSGETRLNFSRGPVDKLEFVRRLRATGRKVMMVGDGLNDAGALKESDVGVAVVEQVGAFSPASDAILEGSGVPRLAGILELSRRAVRIVGWNFGISAAYNLVGVSVAAAGVLSPMLCAVFMPLSSLSVVLFAFAATTRAARVLEVSRDANGSPHGNADQRPARKQAGRTVAQQTGGLRYDGGAA